MIQKVPQRPLEDPLDPARGCVTGLLISLSFWIVFILLAIALVLVLHFFPFGVHP